MTDTQLYIAIGVPIIALIFAMVNNFALVSRIDKRIEAIDRRIDSIEKRIDEQTGRFDKRIEDMRDLLRAEMQRNHSEVMAKFSELDLRMSRLEGERRVIP